METYVIFRRNGWRTADDLQEAADRSTAEEESMGEEVRWIRSYVITELERTVGTICIYQAKSPKRFAVTPTAPTCRSTKSCRSPTP